MQFTNSAATPNSSKRRAARPNASPSGPPQCWPYTPHSPCRQRRNDNHTGSPVSNNPSTTENNDGRTNDNVSNNTKSGGSDANARANNRTVSSPPGRSKSPFNENATAGAAASRANRTP